MISQKNKNAALQKALTEYEITQSKKVPSFLALAHLEPKQMEDLLTETLQVKATPEAYSHVLQGKQVALLFEKTSTRTRCSFETGVNKMGGDASYIYWGNSNFVLANLEDETKVLSGYYDLIMARVFKHETLQTMAAYSEVPVINGLCNKGHPCQVVGDYMTMSEYFGKDLRGLKLAYIGDGNNVCRSLVEGASLLGVNVALHCPEGYKLDKETLKAAGSLVQETTNLEEAVHDADVLYTDTWISMGDEAEKAERLKAFQAYKIDEKTLAMAPKHALVMHCLPAHCGMEISESVLRGPRSIAFAEAKNRRPAQMAIMARLLENRL